MTTREDYGNVYVCVDCYFAHHYGAHEHDGQWFAGDSDTPCDSEPLARLEGLEIADNTCSDHYVGNVIDADDENVALPCVACGSTDEESGIDDFSWRACGGCGSTLGGTRYRLSLWKVAP